MSNKVGRQAQGAPQLNQIALRATMIYFQRFPGTHGLPENRAISGAPYAVKINGRNVYSKQVTDEEGRVFFFAPASRWTSIVLEIFDTEYQIRRLAKLEALDGTYGVQRRLQLLGYEPGAVNGDPEAETDAALLNFQADHALDTTGVADDGTRQKLKLRFGQ